MEKCPDQLGWMGHSSAAARAPGQEQGLGVLLWEGAPLLSIPAAEQKITSQTLWVSPRAAEW